MVVCTKLVESLHRPTVLFKTKYGRELTTALVRAIRNVLTVDGYMFKTEGERKSIDHIVDLMAPFSDVQAVEAVKYLTSFQLPRLVGDEEPKRPDFLPEHSTLFTHEYGRYIGRLNANHGRVTRRQKSLAFSILQIKRGLPPLPKKMKEQAEKDLKTRLTTPGSSPSRLLDEIERTVTELFPTGWDCKPIPSYSPSSKSCLSSSRKDGGTQAFMFDPEANVGTSPIDQILETDTSSMYGSLDPTLPTHPNSFGKASFEEQAKRSYTLPLMAHVDIVDDPLKARPVTKNEWQCAILKPLQRLMHTQLKANPAFRLIGEPLTEEIINCIDLFPGSKYVSGDYKSATDNFHSDATDACLDKILGGMTGPLSRDHELMLLAKNSLTGLWIEGKHNLCYRMERGQLMGSLLSFLVLCIVNFSIWRHCTELSNGVRCDGNGLGGRCDHVLINGDDIGFAATPSAFNLWKSTTPLVGLSPSAGKNYFTKEFIMMNTLMFSWSDKQKKLLSIRFVNLGLLNCPGENCILENQDALGTMHDDFVSGCGDRSAGSGVFIDSHKSLLKTSWRNLFGPRELGGLGATPVAGSPSESVEGYSVRQLIIAKLLDDSKARMYSSGNVGRYDAFQEKYLDRLFPNVFRYSEAMLPESDWDYRWENVTELVGEARIDFLSMVSWLAPYAYRPKSAYFGMNQLKKLGSFSNSGDRRHFAQRQISVERYLEKRGEVFIWQQVKQLFPCGEDVEQCFV